MNPDLNFCFCNFKVLKSLIYKNTSILQIFRRSFIAGQYGFEHLIILLKNSLMGEGREAVKKTFSYR